MNQSISHAALGVPRIEPRPDEASASELFEFDIRKIRFDEDYRPSEGTRITTNFANLARGKRRQENLRNALRMIDNRFNALASWDNPNGDRYRVGIEIVSVSMTIQREGAGKTFPIIEILNTTLFDRVADAPIAGIAGNNFSSYLRDYDFSILLPKHNRDGADFGAPEGFGDLHGNVFKAFLRSRAYNENFPKPPVICLSVSSTRTYTRTANRHPMLGVEYQSDASSLTDRYFEKMGLKARYFTPPGSVAPLAFYCSGDLLGDYTNLELVGVVSTMETFQKIYRPEIYNANSVAGACYRPSLQGDDHSLTRIVYDREERSRLAVEQGRFAQENFLEPYKADLEAWSAFQNS